MALFDVIACRAYGIVDCIGIPTSIIARRAYGIVDCIGIPTSIIARRAYGIIYSRYAGVLFLFGPEKRTGKENRGLPSVIPLGSTLHRQARIS